MAHKELKFNEEARRALQRGVDILADADTCSVAADDSSATAATSPMSLCIRAALSAIWPIMVATSSTRPCMP